MPKTSRLTCRQTSHSADVSQSSQLAELNDLCQICRMSHFSLLSFSHFLPAAPIFLSVTEEEAYQQAVEELLEEEGRTAELLQLRETGQVALSYVHNAILNKRMKELLAENQEMLDIMMW